MFSLRCAVSLRQTLLWAARLGVIGASVVVTGCASNNAAHNQTAHVGGPDPRQGMRVEIEDDGLPAQLAPRNPRPTPDDPSEPWSPNYGHRGPQRAAERILPATPGAPAATLPPARLATTPAPTQVTEMDEDAIIRRAIAEHEMRRND